MNPRLLILLSFFALAFSLKGQSGITISGLVHQPDWNMSENGFWSGAGVRAQFLGKEALRGLPIRFQTGLTASYLNGNSARFYDAGSFGTLGRGASVTNHVGRLGMSARVLSWPAKIRVFAEVEGGAQYVFSTATNSYPQDFWNNSQSDFIGGDLGFYYGLGGGVQYRLLPFLYAQLGLNFTQGSGTKMIDLNSAEYNNGVLTLDRKSISSTGFTEYNLGLYFRLGNHDRKRNNQRRSKDNRDNRSRDRNNRRSPNYWDRG